MSRLAVASLIFFVLSIFSVCPVAAADAQPLVCRGELCHVDTPDGAMRVTLTEWASTGAEEAAELRWRVDRLDAGNPAENLLPDATLSRCPGSRSATTAKLAEDRYQAVHGKRKACGGPFRETTIRSGLGGPANTIEQITLRVSNDGVAWRYHTPARANVENQPAAWTFATPPRTKAWIAPYDKSGEWTPAYEVFYEAGIDAGTESPNAEGWAFPALFELPDEKGWALVTESALPRDYCGTRFDAKPIRSEDGARYRLRFPNPEEGLGTGDVVPTGETTPWYVVILGQTPATIVESTLVADLNPPCEVQDVSWIKPGRAAWSWWSDSDSSKSYAKQLPFIDLAAEMGWEYYLVDANWDLMPDGDIPQMVEYANGKGVGLILWYNSGGPNNIVTERPRDRMYDRETRRAEMKRLAQLGIKGLKIDFWHSDKQESIRRYQETIEDAAEFGLMIDFHGCTIPRGWSRTWPNLMTMESIRGAECYKFDGRYPQMAPPQNTIIPFTRNAIGPMDYTPVTFTKANNPRRTTLAHQLALSVLFESGLQHFADKVSAYRDLPETPKTLLKNVPVAWDDTKYLAGRPSKFVVLARRKGDAWYIAGINGRDEPLDVALDLTPLGDSVATRQKLAGARVTFITDGKDGESWHTTRRMPKTVTLLPRGGFVLLIEP
ncbi:MAG TPA: glycoside hydrolase family 97 catalytic domain-containing protein [Thermoguttaceae bacterium]|nr:glycoside hydrolase family 97 catalytic domain-containing protein [Thermoguttaceae bacterium]